METRRLGKTGHESTVVTFGTYAIGVLEQDEADRVIEEALGRGINHFDVAPTYADAEVRLGNYLKRHPQPDLFIGCKTEVREREGAREALLRTLDRLGRDRFDLYQLHGVCTIDDLEQCFAPGGSMEAILAARGEGLVGHIGITGHGPLSPATHTEALGRFDFASVMTSGNRFLYSLPGFRRDWEALVGLCRVQDAGIHVLKASAKGPWNGRQPTHNTWYEPFTVQRDVDRAIAWVLNQPVTTMCSAGDRTLLAGICDAAERYQSISVTDQEDLLAAPGYGSIFEPSTAA
ncbi:MAG: aldo/keto reductase [Thermomicrobiales bacterium]